MSEQGRTATEQPDSLIGVRLCGCITAWMDLDDSTEDERREFYANMADTAREVRFARLDDIRDRLHRCEHGGIGEFA